VDARVKRGHDAAALFREIWSVDMSNDDWKKSLPFRRHWALYLAFKLLVLALAAFIAWHLLRAFEVV
jgi:hypothetical protein